MEHDSNPILIQQDFKPQENLTLSGIQDPASPIQQDFFRRAGTECSVLRDPATWTTCSALASPRLWVTRCRRGLRLQGSAFRSLEFEVWEFGGTGPSKPRSWSAGEPSERERSRMYPPAFSPPPRSPPCETAQLRATPPKRCHHFALCHCLARVYLGTSRLLLGPFRRPVPRVL